MRLLRSLTLGWLALGLLTIACKQRRAEPGSAVATALDGADSIAVAGVAPAEIAQAKSMRRVPPGAAVYSRAGQLRAGNRPVSGIIQAATGQPGDKLNPELQPTVASVSLSLHNALVLATKHQPPASCTAVSFLMGGKGLAFVRGFETAKTQPALGQAAATMAKSLWQTALNVAASPQSPPVVFMPFGPEEIGAFEAAAGGPCRPGAKVSCMPGGVFANHGCDLMVISSHLDVQFSDHGLSLMVAKGTGEAAAIDSEVRAAIAAWADQ
jgi:hypothetical protein